jgi:hypothetical protein
MRASLALAALAAATGPDEILARATPAALHDLARVRFERSPALVQICVELRTSYATREVDGSKKRFTADDATVIAFFLARNTCRKRIK